MSGGGGLSPQPVSQPRQQSYTHVHGAEACPFVWRKPACSACTHNRRDVSSVPAVEGRGAPRAVIKNFHSKFPTKHHCPPALNIILSGKDQVKRLPTPLILSFLQCRTRKHLTSFFFTRHRITPTSSSR